MARRANKLVLIVLACSWPMFCGCGGEKRAEREVSVAAAADLKFAFDEVASEFQKRNPSIHVTVTYGASGNFYAQLANQAPFDLFLSAGIDYPRKLIDSGLAYKDSEFLYAVGHIVSRVD